MLNDFDDLLVNNIPGKAAEEDKDRTVPYFEPYEIDREARTNGLEPIEFDWSRVCELDAVEEDKKWYETPFYRDMCKRGFKHQRWLVSCATHGYFKTSVMDPPTPKIGFKCQRCISDEINRIVGLRAKRTADLRRRMEETRI